MFFSTPFLIAYVFKRSRLKRWITFPITIAVVVFTPAILSFYSVLPIEGLNFTILFFLLIPVLIIVQALANKLFYDIIKVS